MQTTFATHMRFPLAALAALAAVSLFAQSTLVEQGRAAIGRGDTDAAIEILEKAVAQSPKSAEAHYALGSACASKVQAGGLFAAAQYASRIKEEWLTAVALDPRYVEARFGLVQVYAGAPLKLDPRYMAAFYHLGRVASLANANLARGEEALKQYEAYTPKENEPTLARAHYFLGAVYEKEGKRVEAKQAYQAALKLNPTLKQASEALSRVS